MKDIDKIRVAMYNYLSRKDSSPVAVASDWARISSDVQEWFFEVALNYIREVAEGEHFTPMMRVYSDIAKKMIHAADN